MTYCWGASGVCIIIQMKLHKDINNLIYIPTITKNYLTIRNKESFLGYYEVITKVRSDRIYDQAIGLNWI